MSLLNLFLLSENERENPLIANYVSIIRLRNLDSDSSTRYIRRTVVIPYMARSTIYIAKEDCRTRVISHDIRVFMK